MKQHMQKIVLFVLAFLVLAAAAGVSLYAEDETDDPAVSSSLVVLSYRVTNSNGNAVSRIAKNDLVNIELVLKNTSLKTEDVNAAWNIDISKLVDSFTGSATPSVAVTSSSKQPLVLKVIFNNLTYNGTGKSLLFVIGYTLLDLPYDSVDVTINECVEYAAPEPTSAPSVHMPTVLFSRSQLVNPINPGEEKVITVYVKNSGKTAMKSVVISFTTSEALTLIGGNVTFPMRDIAAGATGSINIKLKAEDVIAAPSQSLTVDLKFDYGPEAELAQGTASDRLLIPCNKSEIVASQAPVILVSRGEISKPVAAGQVFSVVLSFKNIAQAAAETVTASLSTSDALMLLDTDSTYLLGAIAPEQTAQLTVNVKALEEITSASQSISIDLKYTHKTSEGVEQATASEKVTIPAQITKSVSDSPVPNIIISNFSYGGNPVSTGSVFELSLLFLNTSTKLEIENIVMTIETGESFAITSASNTAFYPSLGPGQALRKTIELQALPSAKTGAQAIEIGFKYEYVEGGARASNSMSEKLSIPVYQPDRFEITPSELPEMAFAGEELPLSFSYVNKGKGEIANLEASIEGIDSPVPTQNLGNVAPGESDYIGFLVVPAEAGEVSFTLKITYEDSNEEVKTRDYPITLTVEEPMQDFGGEWEEPVPEPAPSKWKTALWISGGVLALGLIALCIVLRIRKRKAAKKNEYVFDWGDTPQNAIVAEEADAPEADLTSAKG